MPALTYLLTPLTDDHSVITGSEQDFKLHVYKLRGHTFKARPEEIHFYANDHGQLYAFETEAWEQYKLPIITGAITWFADQLGNPGIDITIEPKNFNLRIVK